MGKDMMHPFDVIQEHRFRAFINTSKRARWLVLTTTILSFLLLSHVYLEQFGFQQRQLVGVYEWRIRQGIDEATLKLERDSLQYLFNTDPPKHGTDAEMRLNNRLHRYAVQQQAYDMTQNTLRTTTIPDEYLPLLGLRVPANDYVPIISGLLAIMMVILWLRVRSLDVIERELIQQSDNDAKVLLRENPALLDLLRLYFTFTSARGESTRRGRKVALFLQYTSFWLPVLAVALGTFVDLSPLLTDSLLYSGPVGAIALRVIILVITIVIIVLAAYSCTIKTLNLDRFVEQCYERQKNDAPSTR